MDLSHKIALLRKLLENIENDLEEVRALISELEGVEEASHLDWSGLVLTGKDPASAKDKGRIIEGVFDGQNMIGPDGKQYSVPPNYASKSKLVEGDILKLTIAPDGSFVYKQIQPIERARLIGKLVKEKETENYRVLVDKKLYKVLLASVTYFKGGIGDEAVILVPKDGNSAWAAIENIIKEPRGKLQEDEFDLGI